jgi:hypothetical protein
LIDFSVERADEQFANFINAEAGDCQVRHDQQVVGENRMAESELRKRHLDSILALNLTRGTVQANLEKLGIEKGERLAATKKPFQYATRYLWD